MKREEKMVIVLWNTGDEYWDNNPIVEQYNSIEEAKEAVRQGLEEWEQFNDEEFDRQWNEHHFVSDRYDEEWEVGYEEELEW